MPITRNRGNDFQSQVLSLIKQENPAAGEYVHSEISNIAPSLEELTTAGAMQTSSPVNPFSGYTGFGFYSSFDIPLNILDEMRRDSQVALGMAIVKFPITQLSYTINCENPVISEFIKMNLKNKWSSIVRDCLKALDFGFNGFEKVWRQTTVDINPGLNQRKVRDKNVIMLDKMKPIHPSTLSARVDGKGNLTGLNQLLAGNQVRLPRNKSAMITNDEEYGNFFGRSRMATCYVPWYYKKLTTQFFLRYVERYSIPPYKVKYPPGISRFGNGQQMDNAAIALAMAKSMSSHGNVTVPSTTDENKNARWDVEAVNPPRLNVKPQEIVGYWDVQILRGLLIPDKETLSAMDAETASEVYLSTLTSIVNQIEEKINVEIIQPLVQWNFPADEIVPCSLNIDDIDFKKRSEMRKLLSKILDLSATYVKNTGGLPFSVFPDMVKILEILDIPQKEISINKPKGAGDMMQKKGGPLQKGEQTEGNISRTGRNGDPRDVDKQIEGKTK